jgi:WD40 repeat protein
VTAVATVPDPASLTSPFVGLTSYAQENAAFFFGRDAEQRVLISNLRASRLTLLYAQSGAGKSSVLRAGAAAKLAELARRSLQQRGFARYLPVVFSSWRDDPTGELIAEIEKAIAPFLPKPSPPGRTLERLDEVIEAASTAAGATLLVVLDQFEEYFLYRPREAHDGRFAGELAACINRAGLHANFLISIREDAYSGLGDLFQGRIRNVYSNYLHLEHLTRESAREAIEKPITSFNELHPTEVPVEIESGLADVILGQLGSDQFAPDQAGIGRLPGGNGSDLRGGEIAASYLQLVMKRLWETELTRGSRTLRRATLEELGGAQTIVRTHVDRALDDLPEEAREAAVDIFHHLVTPSGTKLALAASDLAEYTGRPAAESSTLLERLASSDTRILRPVPPPPGHEGGTRYEISHDLLAPAILDWGSRQRAVRLESEKESAERVARVEKRRARTFRTLALGSGALLIIAIIAIVALVVAVIAAHTAQLASQSAARQHTIALSRQLAAESLGVDPTDPLTARRLAVAAWRVFPTTQAYSAMTALLARQQQDGFLPATPPGANGGVSAVAFSPHGKLLASAGSDGTVRLWNPVTGQAAGALLQTGSGSQGGVTVVAFSPNGKLLASADAKGTVRLWNPVTCQPVGAPLQNDPAGVYGLAFSPDGKLLASEDGDNTVRFWNPVTRQPFGAPLQIHGSKIGVVAFSPSGKLTAVGRKDTMRLWDPVTHHSAPLLIGSHARGVWVVAFSPNGKLLATVDLGGTVRLWNPVTRQPVGAPLQTGGAPGGAYGVAFSPNGKLLASIDGNGTVRLWNPVTRQPVGGPLQTGSAPGGPYGVAFSPNSKVLATAGSDGTVRLLDLVTGQPVGAPVRASSSQAGVYGVAFSPDSKLLASAGGDGVLRLWNPVTGEPAGAPLETGAGVGGLGGAAFSPTGKLLATVDIGGTVRLWNPVRRQPSGAPLQTGGAPLQTGGSPSGGAWAVAFSPNGKLLATIDGGMVRLWDPVTRRPTGAPLHVTSRRNGVSAVAFSPNGKLLATIDHGGTVRVWNPATAQRVGVPIHARPEGGHLSGLERVAFSPDSKLLASADGGAVRLWNPVTGRPVGAPLTAATGPYAGVYDVAFSPDGKLLASAGSDGTVQLWNPVSGQPVGAPLETGALNGVYGVAFSPDGKWLASADSAGTVHLWKIWLLTRPYAALCADVGPPTHQDWAKYAPGEPQSRVCA